MKSFHPTTGKRPKQAFLSSRCVFTNDTSATSRTIQRISLKFFNKLIRWKITIKVKYESLIGQKQHKDIRKGRGRGRERGRGSGRGRGRGQAAVSVGSPTSSSKNVPSPTKASPKKKKSPPRKWSFGSYFKPQDIPFKCKNPGIQKSSGLSANSSFSDIFLTLFPPSLVKHICTETNRYWQQMVKKKLISDEDVKVWRDVNENDIKCHSLVLPYRIESPCHRDCHQDSNLHGRIFLRVAMLQL